jgi:hypothetical protein
MSSMEAKGRAAVAREQITTLEIGKRYRFRGGSGNVFEVTGTYEGLYGGHGYTLRDVESGFVEQRHCTCLHDPDTGQPLMVEVEAPMTQEERIAAFRAEVQAACDRWQMGIGGCGCCGSPYITIRDSNGQEMASGDATFTPKSS